MIKLERRQLENELATRTADRAAKLRKHLNEGSDPPDALLNSYRNPELKKHLVEEVHGKCAYCESKVTHVYFGDVEHIKPKSLFPSERLDVDNLTYSCAICNNGKGEYWDNALPFLNPYTDNPDGELLALGYFITRRPGHERARLTIDKLGLNRAALIERRKERIELLQSLADQYMNAAAGSIKDLLRIELCQHAADSGEYAFIVRSYLEAACGLQCN